MNTTNEKPILFKGPMVRAILDEIKTETRRPIAQLRGYGKGVLTKFPGGNLYRFDTANGKRSPITSKTGVECLLPYQVGDILWVKETWLDSGTDHGNIHYRASATQADLEWIASEGWKWKSSMFMPHKHARIKLLVTGVNVQNVQDITEEEAIAEGVEEFFTARDLYELPNGYTDRPLDAFELLWDSIYHDTENAWIENPIAAAYKFRKVK